MDFLSGLKYNLRGLTLGLKTPKLLALGMVRFFLILLLTVIAAILVFKFYQDIFSLIWMRPENAWLIWLWHFLSWIAGLFLFAMAAMAAYLLGQIAFAVLIMDLMAQITERLKTGKVTQPTESSFILHLFFLIKQETPRAIFPVVLSTFLMFLSWLTPLGSILTILLPLLTAVFLAWDNTDLIPARALIPFRERLRFLKKNFLFHLGFGIWFLAPILNILFLSFAPVGGALFYLDARKITENTPINANQQVEGETS